MGHDSLKCLLFLRVKRVQGRAHRAGGQPVELAAMLDRLDEFAGVQKIHHRHHGCHDPATFRSEEHTSELQSLMRISYAVFCLKKKNYNYRYFIYIIFTSIYTHFIYFSCLYNSITI